MRKRVFGHMRTANAQISLWIHTAWSRSSLSGHRITGHYRIYQWRANARLRFCPCAAWIWICAFCACSTIYFRLTQLHSMTWQFVLPAYCPLWSNSNNYWINSTYYFQIQIFKLPWSCWSRICPAFASSVALDHFAFCFFFFFFYFFTFAGLLH